MSYSYLFPYHLTEGMEHRAKVCWIKACLYERIIIIFKKISQPGTGSSTVPWATVAQDGWSREKPKPWVATCFLLEGEVRRYRPRYLGTFELNCYPLLWSYKIGFSCGRGEKLVLLHCCPLPSLGRWWNQAGACSPWPLCPTEGKRENNIKHGTTHSPLLSIYCSWFQMRDKPFYVRQALETVE